MTALTPSGDRVTTIASLFAAMSIGASLAWMYKSQSDRQYKRIPTELLRSTYAKELRLALNLALQCGNNMMQHYSKKGTLDQLSESDLGISTKGCAEDFCTIIDVMNENLVIDGIQTYFPLHNIIGEESTGTGEIPPLTNAPTWIIDPIDGTTNFASGLPLSCVSLGFCVDGKPVLGVVYAPATKEIYLAVRGHGAYRNGVKLDPMKKVTPLSSAVVNTEFGYARSKEAVKSMLQGLGRIKIGRAS